MPRQPWREVDDEVRFHLDMRVRDYLARGFTLAQAEQAARERFGDVERVRRALESHDKRRERMSRFRQDARVALAGFRRSPTFTVTAVLILGLGIGIATAMWTVFHAALIRPLPVADEDRIVLPRILDAAGVDVPVTPQWVEQVRRSSRTMTAMAGVAHWGSSTAPLLIGDQPIVLSQAEVTSNFFQVLGVRPLMGRLMRAEDDSVSRVIVLSYEAWQQKFGGDPSIVGRQLIEPFWRQTHTIIGVAPPGLDYPVGTDCWMPLHFSYGIDAVARLAPGATLAAAGSEYASALKQIHPLPFAVRPDARTFRAAIVGDVRQVVIVLTAAVGLLLLIACVNVGNLLLLRGAARGRELAVRRALGATSADLVWQLVAESTLLGVAGGALGVVIADIARRILIAAAPKGLPGLDVVRAGGVPIVAAVAVALLTALIFGVAPALVIGRGVPASLRSDSRSGRGTRQRRRVRQLLVASQVALALIMLTGAGLLARSLTRLETLNLGYTSDHLSLLQLTFPVNRTDAQHPFVELYEGLATHLHAVPGVASVTPVMIPPFYGTGVWSWAWDIEGQSPAQAGTQPLIPVEIGGPDYFHTLGTPILRGRGFRPQDREHAPMVVVVSEAVARRYWPNQDPIGKRVRLQDDTVWRTVVGVASDIRYKSLREASPTIFLPYRQYYWQGFVMIRTTLRLGTLLPAIRHAVTEVDPDLKVWRAQTMDELLAGPLAEPRLSALLLSTFGLVALTLAAIGLYGIMASAVREETREIGVRLALGATPGRVRSDVLRRALLVCVAGAAVGLAGALAASRVMASLLFQVSPFDPVALLGACGVLLGVALIAAFVPAYQASRIDPSRALQGE